MSSSLLTVSTVLVQATGAVINTDVSNLAETRTGLELNTLPLAISSRASGSTSPFATLTSQAGVQTDSTGNISIAGAKPSLLNVTIDGISTMNVETSAPAAELFPSFNSIEEIRVSQNSNAAEFGGRYALLGLRQADLQLDLTAFHLVARLDRGAGVLDTEVGRDRVKLQPGLKLIAIGQQPQRHGAGGDRLQIHDGLLGYNIQAGPPRG